MVVVDLARAGHCGAVQGKIQVVLRPSATRGHGGWRRKFRCLCLAVWDDRKSIRRTGRHRKRSGRSVRTRRDNQRLTSHVVRRWCGHHNEVAATTGTGRIREVDVEAVIAARLGDLALLSRVVEAGCRQWRGAAQHLQSRARNRRARQRIVDKAIRPHQQVQILEVAAGGHGDVGDALQPVGKG